MAYLKHFAVPPGAPGWMVAFAPIMLIIEGICAPARVLSLSIRLFGNIFGEELVILILATLVPFIVPLPMMFLGLLTGTLQALIFAILTMVYLGGAVAVEHHDDGAPLTAVEHASSQLASRGGFHVSTRSIVATALVLVALGFVSPVYAQETSALRPATQA